MKQVKITVCFLFISVLLVSLWVPMVNPIASNRLSSEKINTENPAPNFTLSYESHSSIFISGDDDFNTTAVNEGWPGDGSSDTPFIIEGYEITGYIHLINIVDTRYHFEIRDCNLTDANIAIGLTNVTNGLIENCLINIPFRCVDLENVTGIDVVGCDISTQNSYGIYMDEAFDCSIENCVIQGGSFAGIYGQFSESITLFNNTVFEFDEHGINFIESYDIDILNNTLYWNKNMGPINCGIYLYQSDLAYIYGNNITENEDNGITLSYANNVTIIENHIVNNSIHGVYVEYSDYCIIQDNYIEGNGEGAISSDPMCGISTYFADYIEIIGNEFWWNAENTITLGYSNYAYVFNNYINHSYNHGMWIYMSHNATIEENEIYNSDGLGGGSTCGVMVEWSNDTQILDNILSHNSENGITIFDSYHGELHANTISDSEYCGLYMGYASEWYISHNVIYDNGGPGIIMDDWTHDNYLWYNDIGWSGEFNVADNGEGNYWNYTGVGNWYSGYDHTGTYLIPGIASETDYYPSVSLYCGVTTPSEYEAGTTGNTMTWNSSALNPGSYELLIDGVSQGQVTWDGGPIAADVDGLAVGEYNVTLVVYHISGHWLANQSVLTVVDTEGPTWTVTPQDQVLEYNEPLSYQLQASDPSGIDSWSLNSTLHFAISETGLLTNSSFLAPGVYYLEITVTDVYSNTATFTLKITVNAYVPPTSQPSDPTVLMLAVGGAGAAIVIILVVYMIKKKSS